eukprot:NODE_7887_length_1541_cov_8.449081.p1 GENE.NODE_7887_length_1541_cov_8.449081~~NODE_7887_length_1541_cov_8.449081.p1  ORF type:complete len:295 (+),score=65.35 NODE_7887_length_1541_cov_8.449081:471-1355(+)
MKPDFTSLDVISFCSGSLPLGICLPNYDEVRRDVGFKNVDLGNVCSARNPAAFDSFLTPTDSALFKVMYSRADQVLTGLHELIGHGSGKLLQISADGVRNYSEDLLNPVTGAPVASCYKPGETYGAVFGVLASPVEECRAECVSLYFNPEQRTWGAVHGRARYAILRHLLHVGEGLLNIEVDESATPPDCRLHMNRSLICSVGHKAIGDLLLRIHVARCTADRSAVAFFEDLTDVPEYFLRLRNIILGRRKPRDIFAQPTTVLDESSGEVMLRTYPPTREGVLRGFVDRYRLHV